MSRSVLLSTALLAACGGASPPRPSPTSGVASLAGDTFVLVHGAWMGAWSWSAVEAGLEGRGARVIAVELPGHGADMTAVAQTSLDAYVQAVEAAIDAASGRVVLVGHSMGGVVISQVAEHRADRLAGLVYVAAYVPGNQQSLQELAGTDSASSVGPVLQIDPTTGVARLPASKLADLFCGDCPPAALATLVEKYRDEPLPAFAAPVLLTEAAWGRVPKFYVYTSADHAVSPALQRSMTAKATWTDSATIATGHAPMLSRPDELAAMLGRFAHHP